MPTNILSSGGLNFPNISPIALSIGPLHIHWYGIGYAVAILFAYYYARYLLRKSPLWANNCPPFKPEKLDDLLIYAPLGIVVGGRLAYVLFYDLPYYITHPIDIIKIWDGGMSFHGGLIGASLAIYFVARRNAISLWSLFDLMACAAPFGIGLVRICNFINSELWGRVTNVSWGVKFPNGGYDQYGNLLVRHPSQIYEALLEGLVLFIILWVARTKFKSLAKPAQITGLFLTFYSIFRIFVEFFRQPDIQLGFLYGQWLTMGILLTLPILMLGIILLIYSKYSKPPANIC